MASKSELQIFIKTFFEDRGISLADKEVKELEKSLKNAQSASSKFKTALKGLGGVAAAAGLAVGVKEIIDFGVASVQAAEQQAQAEAQLRAVIKSTGGAAGVTADEVKRLASEL